MSSRPLGTIEQELADCRAACAAYPDAQEFFFLHHGVPLERLTEPVQNRIDFILSNKPEGERAVRLRNLRPCKDQVWAAKQQQERDALYAKQQPEWAALAAKQRPEWAALAAKQQPEWAALHAIAKVQFDIEWPDNTWNGKDSIC